MVKFKIGKETYGLILITSNVCDFLLEENNQEGKRPIDIMINSFKEIEDSRNEVEYINFWTLLGIHDIAILIKSDSKLDAGIIKIGESLNKIEGITVEPPTWLNTNEKISHIFMNLKQCSKEEKKIKIFDYWCEPLIPLYINDIAIKNTTNNCVILYYRLNAKTCSYNELLNRFEKRIENNPNILGVFNGFGIFDLVVIIKFDSYIHIPNTINELNSCFEANLFESCSLLCSPDNEKINENDEIYFSVFIKVNPCGNKPINWNDMEYLAKQIGISRIYIETIDKPFNITYKQGFFDIIFVGYGTLKNFSRLCRIFESLPFIIDINANLNIKS